MAGHYEDKAGELGLAAEVARQAVRDYRSAVKRLKKDVEDTNARSVLLEVEQFFLSTYGQCLLQTDGEAIIARLHHMRRKMGFASHNAIN